MVGIGLAAPAKQKLLGRGLTLGDDLVRNDIRLAVGDPCRPGDDRHHLRRKPAKIDAGLLVGDLVQLAEPPDARETCGLGLQIGRSVAGEGRRLVGLWIRHLRIEVVIDEESPDIFVRVAADELLDVDAPITERAPLPIGFGDLRLHGHNALETGFEIVRHRAKSYTHRAPLQLG